MSGPQRILGFSRAGDLNGDGKADVVITSNYADENTIRIYLSKGDGTFSVSQIVGPKRPRTEVLRVGRPLPLLKDLNGDNHLDLILPDLWQGGVAILYGNGDGTFQPPINLAPRAAGPDNYHC